MRSRSILRVVGAAAALISPLCLSLAKADRLYVHNGGWGYSEGFYGGNGVFYGDDGYSRQTVFDRTYDSPRSGSYDNPHVIYLPRKSNTARR